MLAEGVVLARLHRSGRAPAPARLLPTLCAGFALVAALLLALLGAPEPALYFCLVLALACHVADLRSRWRE